MTKRMLTIASLTASLLCFGTYGCESKSDADSKESKKDDDKKKKDDDEKKDEGDTKEAKADAKFSEDQQVEVEWKGSWYKAKILAVEDGKYKIHYEGWSDSFDETVEEKRVREPEGIEYDYAVGDIVEVQWKDKWYKSKILEVQGEDKFKIHYEGWDDKWDEVVEGNRIRRPEA